MVLQLSFSHSFLLVKLIAKFPSSRLLQTHKVHVNATFSQDKLNYFTRLREKPELKSKSLGAQGFKFRFFFASGDMGAA